MSDEYYPGKGCQCEAHSQSECGCDGVDWRSRREVKLEATIATLAAERAEATSLIMRCLRAMPVGNVALHTPDSLPDRIRDLAGEVGMLSHENDTLTAENERLKAASATRRMFPIQAGPSVPWEVMAPHDDQCRRNHGGQTIERIAQRGGLSPCEAWYVVNGLKYDDHGAIAARFKWIEYAERINLHYNELDQLRKELAEAKAALAIATDPDMYWDSEDSETQHASPEEWLEAEDWGIEHGHKICFLTAKTLPREYYRVENVSDDDQKLVRITREEYKGESAAKETSHDKR